MLCSKISVHAQQVMCMRGGEEEAALPVASLIYPQSSSALKIWMKCHHLEGGKFDAVVFDVTTCSLWGEKKHLSVNLVPR